eukprot:4157975-Pleurochrysis_carterae.AAC.1
MPDGGRVSKLTLDRALEYDHYASTAYQAEVGLLSRRIVVQGAAANSPPTDTTPARCEETPAVVRVTDYAPCPNTYLTGYGGHVMASGSQSTARVAGEAMSPEHIVRSIRSPACVLLDWDALLTA